MTLKILGAIMVIVGCAGFGLTLVTTSKYEINTLMQLETALEYMQWELEYRLTPLPELFLKISGYCNGPIKELFKFAANNMMNETSPNAEGCLLDAALQIKRLPKQTYKCIVTLGKTLGEYDLNGQINGIQAVKRECDQVLKSLTQNKDVRFRSYKTLGLCAGAAIALLFI
jgi:stage III sporulation protein AB